MFFCTKTNWKKKGKYSFYLLFYQILIVRKIKKFVVNFDIIATKNSQHLVFERSLHSPLSFLVPFLSLAQTRPDYFDYIPTRIKISLLYSLLLALLCHLLSIWIPILSIKNGPQ